MNTAWWALIAGLSLLTTALTPTILRRLPRSADAPPYASLATPAFLSAVGTASLTAGVIVGWRAAHPLVWCGLMSVGALQIVIDARTTWLPLPLSHALWAMTSLGVLVLAVTEPATAGRALAGALVAGVLFALFWRWGGIGFGDVRLMLAVGAAACTQSWQYLLLALLVGTALGALHGIVHRLVHGRGVFPYGPSLWAGAVLGLIIA